MSEEVDVRRSILPRFSDKVSPDTRGRVVAAILWLLPFGVPCPTQAASYSPAAEFLSFRTGTNPASVAIGDVNGDGESDLIVANYGGYAPPYLGSVSVLLGHGDGTFEPKRDFATGHASTTVAFGDLNGDGKLDLAVANYGAGDSDGSVSVLLGNGDGSFKHSVDVLAGRAPYSVVVGDLNGDGKQDLAVANWNSNTASVLMGNGDGTFGPKTDFPTGDVPKDLAIGDLNGDGTPDLAVADYGSDQVSVLLGTAGGFFAPMVSYTTGAYPTSVVIADYDRDGKPDLAVSSALGDSVSFLHGNGDGTFGLKSDWATGPNPWSMAGGDLNGDGAPDLVTADAAGNSVTVLLGSGDGTFSPPSRYAAGLEPLAVAIGDLNGDGLPDLAVACNGRVPGIIAVLLAINDGTFGPKLGAPVGPQFELLSLAPNPSHGNARVTFSVPQEARVRLGVFDVQGRRVGIVADHVYAAGSYEERMDRSNVLLRTGSGGVFLVRLEWPGGSTVRRVVIIP